MRYSKHMVAGATAGSMSSSAVQQLLRHSLRADTPANLDIVSLAEGDPSISTPKHRTDALAEAVSGGATHYGDPQGDPDLRLAISRSISEQAAHAFSDDQI